MTQNYAVDIMHDILEEVCKYDIGIILKKIIYGFNYFTNDNLNNRIEFFNNGLIDIHNRPPFLSTAILKNGTIKMSASEMLFYKIFNFNHRGFSSIKFIILVSIY